MMMMMMMTMEISRLELVGHVFGQYCSLELFAIIGRNGMDRLFTMVMVLDCEVVVMMLDCETVLRPHFIELGVCLHTSGKGIPQSCGSLPNGPTVECLT
jgi:hypothetical protein